MLNSFDIQTLENELCDLKMMTSAMRHLTPGGEFTKLTAEILMKSLHLAQVFSAVTTIHVFQQNVAEVKRIKD